METKAAVAIRGEGRMKRKQSEVPINLLIYSVGIISGYILLRLLG